MNLKNPKNINYSAIVVEIKTIVPLANCNNVQGAIILNNQVIVDKSTKVGDIGLFFGVENQLSKEFLSANNLYRDTELNVDKTKKGYFDENGRVRCQKFVKHDSEGFYIPLNSLEFTGIDINELNIGDEFDEINDIEICRKYVVKKNKTNENSCSSKKNKRNKLEDKLVDKQFKFHEETKLLFKCPNVITPDTLVHVSTKCHGSSAISANVLVKKNTNLLTKIGKFLGIKYNETEYGYIYSSGKPKSGLPKGIVGKYVNKNSGYYSDDIWKTTFEDIKDFLTPGLSVYYEIVGYTKSGSMIQSGYDYGCVPPKEGEGYKLGVNYDIYIYRVSMTGVDGTTYEFSPMQVREWALRNGLKPVELLFYGYASEMFKLSPDFIVDENLDFGDSFLMLCKYLFNEKDCHICNNKVPEEGCVIRIDGFKFQAYKVKSTRFSERETKELDKGEVNIEDEA